MKMSTHNIHFLTILTLFLTAIVTPPIHSLNIINMESIEWKMHASIIILEFSTTEKTYIEKDGINGVLVIKVKDINSTHASVEVFFNNILMLPLIVNKRDNMAFISGENELGFNPFYVFTPKDPPEDTYETKYMGTSIVIKYLKKYTYKEVVTTINESYSRMYEIYDVCSAVSEKYLRIKIIVGEKYENGTRKPVYGETNEYILKLTYKGSYPISLRTIIPGKYLEEEFRIKYNITKDHMIIINAYIPMEYKDEIELLKTIDVNVPLKYRLMDYLPYIIIGIIVVIVAVIVAVKRMQRR